MAGSSSGQHSENYAFELHLLAEINGPLLQNKRTPAAMQENTHSHKHTQNEKSSRVGVEVNGNMYKRNKIKLVGKIIELRTNMHQHQ